MSLCRDITSVSVASVGIAACVSNRTTTGPAEKLKSRPWKSRLEASGLIVFAVFRAILATPAA